MSKSTTNTTLKINIPDSTLEKLNDIVKKEDWRCIDTKEGYIEALIVDYVERNYNKIAKEDTNISDIPFDNVMRIHRLIEKSKAGLKCVINVFNPEIFKDQFKRVTGLNATLEKTTTGKFSYVLTISRES